MQGKPTKQQCGSTSALCPSGSAPCSSQCERQVECARQHVVRHAQAAAVVGQAGQATPRAAVQAVAGAAPRMARCLVSIPLHTDMEDRTWNQLQVLLPANRCGQPSMQLDRLSSTHACPRADFWLKGHGPRNKAQVPTRSTHDTRKMAVNEDTTMPASSSGPLCDRAMGR